jgi:hypothetical protein
VLQISQAAFLPAKGGAAGVVGVFSIGLMIAEKAGLFGLPLMLILVSWATKYAYVLFDHRARGLDGTPTLDIQMVNPFNEQRPLAQMVIVAAIGAVVAYIGSNINHAAGVGLAIGLLLLLPASVAVLGLENNPFRALNPVALFRMVRCLGVTYLIILALCGFYAAIIALIWQKGLWPLVRYAISIFLFLSAFSVLAAGIYTRRDRLGIDVWQSPEIEQSQKQLADIGVVDRLADEAFALVRARQHDKAWKTLTEFIASRGNQAEDYESLCARLDTWDDKRYVLRLSQEYIERLIELRKPSAALRVAESRLRSNTNFRPKTGASTLLLADAAAKGGAVRSARLLLTDFAKQFPADAAADAARHLLESLAP